MKTCRKFPSVFGGHILYCNLPSLKGTGYFVLEVGSPRRDLPYPEQVLPFSADFGHRKKKKFCSTFPPCNTTEIMAEDEGHYWN
jgi:hypothetical protein